MAKSTGIPRLYKQYRVYYYVTRVDGKKKWIRLSADFQEALYKYAELEGNPKNTGLVKDTIARYRGEILAGKSEKSKKDQGYQLNILVSVFGDMHLDAIEPAHIQQYLDQKQAKVAANRDIKLLSKIYRHAIVWGLCAGNPCKEVFYNTEKERERYITDAEFILLQEKADTSTRAIIQLAYLTGMRRGDILKLQRQDITDAGVYVQQGKTGKRQLFKMTPDLKRAVNLAKGARELKHIKYLFTNRKNEPITVTGFNSTWRRLRDDAGVLDLTFHDIRAKAITDANEKGGLDYAQALGGHENRDMTERYIKSKSTDIIDPVQ